MRPFPSISLFVGAAVIFAVAPASASARVAGERTPEARFDHASGAANGNRGADRHRAVLDNFGFVRHTDLGGEIDFADVWARGDYAYVGTSCGASRTGGGGVKVVDISRPRHPRVVSSLPNDEFTRAQDVVVRRIRTPFFTGDLAVVGIQACLGSGHEGESAPDFAFSTSPIPRTRGF
jgi:hypothetical protein